MLVKMHQPQWGYQPPKDCVLSNGSVNRNLEQESEDSMFLAFNQENNFLKGIMGKL